MNQLHEMGKKNTENERLEHKKSLPFEREKIKIIFQAFIFVFQPSISLHGVYHFQPLLVDMFLHGKICQVGSQPSLDQLR